LERAAARIEYQSDAHPHHPHPQRSRSLSFALPGGTDFREKTGSRRGGFVQDLVAAGAVIPGGGGADQRGRPAGKPGQRSHQVARAVHAALQDPAPGFGRPALAHVLARQVNYGILVAQVLGRRLARDGVPHREVRRGRRRGAGAAAEDVQLVARGGQSL
jgi:hypothetical protein